MSDAVIVGLLSLAGTVIASYLLYQKTVTLVSYRLEQLEKKVEKHNKVIERTYNLEAHSLVVDEEITQLENKVERLEHYHSD